MSQLETHYWILVRFINGPFIDTQDNRKNLSYLKLDISENHHLKTRVGTIFMNIETT